MFRVHSGYSYKRMVAWSIVPICLFLVSLGIRVPDLSRLHSSPKPTSRAVIESTCKSGKQAVDKQVVALELPTAQAELLAPSLIATRFLPVVNRFDAKAAPRICARAPPASAS